MMIDMCCFIDFVEAIQYDLIAFCSTVRLLFESIQSWLTKPCQLLQSKAVWR